MQMRAFFFLIFLACFFDEKFDFLTTKYRHIFVFRIFRAVGSLFFCAYLCLPYCDRVSFPPLLFSPFLSTSSISVGDKVSLAFDLRVFHVTRRIFTCPFECLAL